MLATRIHRFRGQEGITLIEALISMIILAIISTMIIMGWANLQRASATALRENNARASLRDAMSRISTEVRAAQPTALPSLVASATPVELLQEAGPMEVQFYSAFNTEDADLDGTGVDTMRLTRIWLDPDEHPPSWNQQCGTLFWQRDTNDSGTIDSGDRTMVLARNVANDILEDTANGTDYTAVFRYGYRATESDPVEWTDNEDGALDLATVVAVSVRLIIDKNMGTKPNYVDLTTTVRLRNVIDEFDE
jgi:type II secretory pathway pseudopilin PulG